MNEIFLRRTGAPWKELSSESKGGGTMAYRSNASRRFCSTTPPAGVPKSSSSAMMREMRASNLSATGAVSCGLVCKMTLKKMSETNFAMDINGGNGSQDGFECT